MESQLRFSWKEIVMMTIKWNASHFFQPLRRENVEAERRDSSLKQEGAGIRYFWNKMNTVEEFQHVIAIQIQDETLHSRTTFSKLKKLLSIWAVREDM